MDTANTLNIDVAATLDERAEAYVTIAAALDWLRSHADAQPSLRDLSDYVGLSEFHLQKVFARWAGVSPKRFLQHLARDRARAALVAGDDMLSASLAAGLSGPGRLHDLVVTLDAVTPGEMKSGGDGLTLSWGLAPTPFGLAMLAESPRGLVKLAFLEKDEHAGSLTELHHDWPAANIERDDVRAASTATRLFTHYAKPEPVHLFVRGTQFQLKVWNALLKVPEGRLTTYGELAASLGQPTAARAVGSAVGANPIALLIPCHRVIRADGGLGGYRWGETRKQAVIGMELAQHAI
ncbi:MAG: methylated-DNA--[protein]-cysteine S-methyltransferase [Burkholderiales bacterium]|nr:methylated-DNA--[protein]-cysteine S-methyltransferase [Burkholderiales bacterium]